MSFWEGQAEGSMYGSATSLRLLWATADTVSKAKAKPDMMATTEGSVGPASLRPWVQSLMWKENTQNPRDVHDI